MRNSVFIDCHKILFFHPFSLSLSLSFFASFKNMIASSIFHVHTCEYLLRKQIVIIRRELEDKFMKEQREREEKDKKV